MRRISPVLWLLLALMLSSGCTRHDSRIREAVNGQLELYPESTLQDIYKSFFQDRYGPGHLLEDTTLAWQYFEYELEGMVSRKRYEPEPCGLGERFYRVNLDMVKDGLIDKERFFRFFISSSNEFRLPSVDEWRIEWLDVLGVIEDMNINLPGYMEQKFALDEMLQRGDYVVHHSERFSALYDPHYRIIGKKQYEAMIGEIKRNETN